MDALRPPPAKPPVVGWCQAYCAAMALMYLAVFVAGLVVVVMRERLAQQDAPPVLLGVWGAFITLLGLVFAAVFAAALLLPPRPWVWIYDIVLICVGLSSPCCMLASIPLLVFWIRPEARAYFGRGDPTPTPRP
jgi:hypothetical protein